MSDLFDTMGNYVPLIILAALWAALVPVRAAVILLLPPISRYNHPLREFRDFFAFDWK